MLEAIDLNPPTDSTSGLDITLQQIVDAIRAFDEDVLPILLQDLLSHRMPLEADGDLRDAQQFVQRHEAFSLLMEDPYTSHAFNKPRGFAGDASMIDLFYGHRSGWKAHSKFGRLVFETLMRSASCDAVRYRRGYYGAFLDRIAGQKSGRADVLALACGHLREAQFSRAVTDRSIDLTGIDSDPLAVVEAQRCLADKGVEVRNNSVFDFVRRRAWGKTYDAIYAAGLFDYLDERIGSKIISTGFEALNPGGTLSVANFLPGIVERGYMDLVMDWRLIYRSPQEMLKLANGITSERADKSVWTDPTDTVVYLTITKRL